MCQMLYRTVSADDKSIATIPGVTLNPIDTV